MRSTPAPQKLQHGARGTVYTLKPLHSFLMEAAMLTGSLLWLLGVPIPFVILLWFFFLRGR